MTGTSTDAGTRWADLAQRLWQLVEPIHAQVYFAPAHRAACDRLGLRGGWMACFASRAAPLGAASAPLVTAVFHGFSPGMVNRAIPDAWSHATPAAVLDARLAAMDEVMPQALGGTPDARDLRDAADRALTVATAGDPAGRPLFAGNLALDVPAAPHLALWHATTLLREHRGDGHVAALTAAGIDGCEAHVLQVAAGVVPREHLQPHRGWSDADWQAATDRLAERGWLRTDGSLSTAGRAARAEVAARTDALASAPLRAVGADHAEALLHLLRPVTAHPRRRQRPVPEPDGPVASPPPPLQRGSRHLSSSPTARRCPTRRGSSSVGGRPTRTAC